MPMLPPATYAALIVGPNAASLPYMTNLVTQIQAMIKAATVAVPATGLVSAAPGSPVTGAAVGTIT